MLAAPCRGEKRRRCISVRGCYLVLPSAPMEEAFQPKMSKPALQLEVGDTAAWKAMRYATARSGRRLTAAAGHNRVG